MQHAQALLKVTFLQVFLINVHVHIGKRMGGERCECHEKFTKILNAAVSTLIVEILHVKQEDWSTEWNETEDNKEMK